MKVYQGHSASPGLVMGQVSRLERWHENFSAGPFNAEREQRLLETLSGQPSVSWTAWQTAAAPRSRPSSCSRA